jgi:N-acetylmuramoyl-L-alanine amidase
MDSEISQLDKPELYLLRNAISGSHGYPFHTAKLSKYAARMGWSQLTAQFKPEQISAIEQCNAFFLAHLHPNQELGALGRGILIKDTNPDTADFLRPAICACLAQPKIHVDCQRNSDRSNRTDFRERVDLIFEIEQGPRNKIEWTFLDEGDVAAADIDIFKNHEEKFYAAALDFNVAVQSALEAANQNLTEIGDAKSGPYWGVRLVLSPDTRSAMARSPIFAHKLAEGTCDTLHHSLETVGPFIPGMVSPVPFRPDPNSPMTEIYDKPIKFDDVRSKLTKDYVKRHYGVAVPEIEFVPSMMIVHLSNTRDLQHYFDSVRAPTLPGEQGDESIGAAEVNASTHYVVDRNGTIFSFMKDFQIARHSIGLDRHAIGITAIGDREQPLTDEQAAATAGLVRYLRGKYTTAKWLVGDAEAFSFQGTGLWEETLPFKTRPEADPGTNFMEKLRHYLSDLQFSSLP